MTTQVSRESVEKIIQDAINYICDPMEFPEREEAYREAVPEATDAIMSLISDALAAQADEPELTLSLCGGSDEHKPPQGCDCWVSVDVDDCPAPRKGALRVTIENDRVVKLDLDVPALAAHGGVRVKELISDRINTELRTLREMAVEAPTRERANGIRRAASHIERKALPRILSALDTAPVGEPSEEVVDLLIKHIDGLESRISANPDAFDKRAIATEIVNLVRSHVAIDAIRPAPVVGEEALVTAYLRGAVWWRDNGLSRDAGKLVQKAARDYADKKASDLPLRTEAEVRAEIMREHVEPLNVEIEELCKALWKREPGCEFVVLNYPEIAAKLRNHGGRDE